MNDEVLNALVDKTVDNAKAIREVKDQIAAMNPEAVVAAVDRRMAELEAKVGEVAQATGERMGKLAKKMDDVGNGVAGVVMNATGPNSGIVTHMRVLEKGLEDHVQFFTNPTTKEVHHRHFVGKAIWILLVLGLVIALLGVALYRSLDREALYEQHDILWRGAMQSDDTAVTTTLIRLQNSYTAGSEQFRNDVVDEERRRAELYERWWTMQKTSARIKELEGQKKKK